MNTIKNYFENLIERIIWTINNKEYWKKVKYFTLVIFCLYIWFIIVPIFNYFIYKNINIFEVIRWYSLIFSLIWIVITAIYILLAIPWEYIEPDIGNLPSKLGKNKVKTEYNPPKWLNASEVWLIYYKECYRTNLECILYKRENKKLIKREYMNNYWARKIIRLDELRQKVPQYEKDFWNMIFWVSHDTETFELKILSNPIGIREIHEKLINYCVEKWRINIEYEKNTKQHVILYIILFIIGYATLPAVALIFTLFFAIIKLKNSERKTNIWKITRTEEWEKLFAEIIWYKHFLEECEERQMKTLLKDDPSYKDKTLPYIIALRMDRKFLDKEYLKNSKH